MRWLFACAFLGGCMSSPDPGGGGGGGGGGLTVEQQHTLDGLNGFRAQNGAPPLTVSPQLNMFADEGSIELQANGMPHQHFKDAAKSGALWTAGFCNGAAENQAPGWPASDVNATVDAILQQMMDEGPGGGHHDNIVNPENALVGVGLLVQNGQLWFTNDFSPPCN